MIGSRFIVGTFPMGRFIIIAVALVGIVLVTHLTGNSGIPGNFTTKAKYLQATPSDGADPALSPVQRIRILEYCSKHTATDVDPATLKAGARVPEQIVLTPIPSELADAMARYRGHSCALVGNQLVIVAPGSRKVVAVIP
jgi:hypothetical protein